MNWAAGEDKRMAQARDEYQRPKGPHRAQAPKPAQAGPSLPGVPTISEAEWQAAKARTDAWAGALALPNGWLEVRNLPPQFEGQRAWQHIDGRCVIGTVGAHDVRWWLHVSVSRAKYIPSYDDLADVKRVFVGDALQALQIFPRAKQHVNIHPYCLHLWACLEPEGDGLPAFGAEGTI
jgi:hypothetical protein